MTLREYIISDQALEPEIPAGATAFCSEKLKPASGDFIVYLPASGGAPLFRRFVPQQGGKILLQAVNRAFDSYTAEENALYSRGKVLVIASIGKTFRKDVPAEEPEVRDDVWLTFVEAAKMLKVKRTKMYALLHSGELRANKFGKTWRIAKSEVRRALMEKRQKKL